MDFVQFLDMALSRDMIVIYGLIFFMAVLLIIIFSIDARNKKRSLDESQIVIQGTVPLEEFKVANHLEEKLEQKIKELEEVAKEEKTEIKEEDIDLNTIEPIKEVEEELEKLEENVEKAELDKKEEIKEEIEDKESNIQYEKEKTEEEKQEEAKEKLNEVAMSLIDNPEEEAVELTNFEIEQEENAIISYKELVKVSDDLYEKNEVTQYADEGNEPITLDQLRLKFEDDKSDAKAEVVTEESASSLMNAIDSLLQEEKPKVVDVEKPKVKLNDFIVVKEESIEEKKEVKFQSSPIISPVYGIEKEIEVKKQTELELEQTADLEKLDAELRKTNQFLQVLKELQKKLD